MKITKILGLALLTASAFTSANAATVSDPLYANKSELQLKRMLVAQHGLPLATAHHAAMAGDAEQFSQDAHANDFNATFDALKAKFVAAFVAQIAHLGAGNILDAAVRHDGSLVAGIAAPADQSEGAFAAAFNTYVNAPAFNLAASGVVAPATAAQKESLKRIGQFFRDVNQAMFVRAEEFVDNIIAGGDGTVMFGGAAVIDGSNDANGVAGPGDGTKGEFKDALTRALAIVE